MDRKTVIKKRLEYWNGLYEKLQEAYIALVEGKVKSYTIDDRQLTRFDLSDMLKQMEEIEQKIDELEAALNGTGARKIVGIVPRNW